MIVGGLHAVDVQEGEEAVGIARWILEPLPKIFGGRMSQGRTTESAESALERRLALPGVGEGDQAVVSVPAELTAVGEEISEALAEGERQ